MKKDRKSFRRAFYGLFWFIFFLSFLLYSVAVRIWYTIRWKHWKLVKSCRVTVKYGERTNKQTILRQMCHQFLPFRFLYLFAFPQHVFRLWGYSKFTHFHSFPIAFDHETNCLLCVLAAIALHIHSYKHFPSTIRSSHIIKRQVLLNAKRNETITAIKGSSSNNVSTASSITFSGSWSCIPVF